MDWPLREMLLAYLDCLREAALRKYEMELQVWSSLAPYQRRKTDPPALPRVLKG